MSYFSRGRHRVPTRTVKNVAAVAVAGAIGSTGITGVAYAGPDGGWGPIISCESGGNPTVKNAVSTASGLFQFINGTWLRYGGAEFAPTARQATAAEQYIVAERAYANEGTSPWNASKGCWEDKIVPEPVVKAPTVAATVQPPKAALRLAKPQVEQLEAVTTPLPIDTYQALAPVVSRGSYTGTGTGDYTIVSGDTLSQLALEEHTTVNRLMELNTSVIETKDWIYAGEKISLH